MDKYFHSLIMKEYEKRRKLAYDSLKNRLNGLYTQIDGLEDIDREIGMLGLKYNRLILMRDSVLQNQLIQAEAELDNHKRMKIKLLESKGYSADYIKPVFKCNICEDKGYVDKDNVGKGNSVEKCSCYYELLYVCLYSASNLAALKENIFESFNEGYFHGSEDNSDNKTGISPRENILGIKRKCLEFIDKFDDPDEKNLFFSGSTGAGKTFMAGCIGNELLKRHRKVLYYSAPQLFNVIYKYKQSAARENDYEDRIYDYIYDSELLIIDDLGTEPPSGAKFTDLLNILNTRQQSSSGKLCKTLISANIGVKELYEYYDERIASRIIGNFDIIKFIGDDVRRIKLLDRRNA